MKSFTDTTAMNCFLHFRSSLSDQIFISVLSWRIRNTSFWWYSLMSSEVKWLFLWRSIGYIGSSSSSAWTIRSWQRSRPSPWSWMFSSFLLYCFVHSSTCCVKCSREVSLLDKLDPQNNRRIRFGWGITKAQQLTVGVTNESRNGYHGNTFIFCLKFHPVRKHRFFQRLIPFFLWGP